MVSYRLGKQNKPQQLTPPQKGGNMAHGYHFNQRQLTVEVKEIYTGGECEILTQDGDVYRGRVKRFRITDKKVGFLKKEIAVTFERLYKHKKGCDKNGNAEDRWELVATSLSGDYEMLFVYRIYYIQKSKNRLKLKVRIMKGGEYCRFYRKNDPTNIVPDLDQTT